LSATWLPEGEIAVSLRRDLTPKANLARIFRRAKGLTAARASIAERLAACDKAIQTLHAAIEELSDIVAALQSADGRAELAVDDPSCMDQLIDPRRRLGRVIASLKSLGVRLPTTDASAALDKHARRRLARQSRALPKGIIAFKTAAGTDVIAGRSASANDVLVTRVARGRDVWMHVRDRTGAHLLLRMKNKDTPPDSRDLLDCAMLVAHLSGVAKGDRVEVSWTRAKHVRKVRGMPAGQVFIAGEKTLLVAVEGAVIDGFYTRRSG